MAATTHRLALPTPDRLRRWVRAAGQRAAARLYLATGGRTPAPAPSVVSIPLTAACNKRCNFCEINGVERHLKDGGKSYIARPAGHTSMIR